MSSSVSSMDSSNAGTDGQSVHTNAAQYPQTQRLTDRQTGQTDRLTTDRKADRQTDRQTYRRQTDRQQTEPDDYRQIDKQTDRQSGRTDRQADRAGGQTDRRRPTERKDMTDRTPTRLPESIAVYGNRSHRQSHNLPLACCCRSRAALCVSHSRTHTIGFS